MLVVSVTQSFCKLRENILLFAAELQFTESMLCYFL